MFLVLPARLLRPLVERLLGVGRGVVRLLRVALVSNLAGLSGLGGLGALLLLQLTGLLPRGPSGRLHLLPLLLLRLSGRLLVERFAGGLVGRFVRALLKRP